MKANQNEQKFAKKPRKVIKYDPKRLEGRHKPTQNDPERPKTNRNDSQ